MEINNIVNNSRNNNEDLSLYLLEASVGKIIPPDNTHLKAYYLLTVKNNSGKHWIKKATFEEIQKFRDYLLKYEPTVESYPFPTFSILSYFPIIGKKYTENNWDVLIEFKFILDNFFSNVCQNLELYKLSEFKPFFEEDKNTGSGRLSTFSFIRA